MLGGELGAQLVVLLLQVGPLLGVLLLQVVLPLGVLLLEVGALLGVLLLQLLPALLLLLHHALVPGPLLLRVGVGLAPGVGRVLLGLTPLVGDLLLGQAHHHLDALGHPGGAVRVGGDLGQPLLDLGQFLLGLPEHAGHLHGLAQRLVARLGRGTQLVLEPSHELLHLALVVATADDFEMRWPHDQLGVINTRHSPTLMGRAGTTGATPGDYGQVIGGGPGSGPVFPAPDRPTPPAQPPTDWL